ncbi:Uncharacterised protein [Streptococcus dysgalactiae subsp. dysgalactiae]|uniref:Uncharacterized protein n=1 Tax=Streptococcus dysgalactiae subsp. dysgalactiae TaxID=99822 RepID=A0A380JSJ6_STRDY|nr:hypothetical protein SDD27957_10860 [Streptococcus dysgalactiae subsp. dysgalactiae ATCC 27957]SUN46781.1 Uncharacterised protein [Streptococcus dysgalactiae subsp. dysgalactiae]SUN48304.1 Uncharacterised protein [Streptococcus dysgalactiae subsp. dysgalactiae]SUN52283.1 Uncharacterised protein [Streptococcus dysgalactiae]SUN56286.1 Uncharacterised protein [Streptococcus dysgalactiae]
MGKKLNQRDAAFLKAYQAKSLHRFRELQHYAMLCQKLTK